MKRVIISILSFLLTTTLMAQSNTDKEILSAAIKDLKSSAAKVKAEFPSAAKIAGSKSLTKKGKELFTKISGTIKKGAAVTDKTTKDEYLAIVKELNSATEELKGSDGGKSAKKNNGTGIGGGTGGIFNEAGNSCVTNCRLEYSQCVSENQCQSHWGVCICCVPCSLQYMGCIRRCVIF